jgi:NADH:ubiquinone reductase (H+-translocating)
VRIPARCIVWAAGVASSPAAKWLDCPRDRAGRAIVDPDLSVPSHPEIFVIGDAAAVTGRDGSPVPGIAPAAKQEGRYVAAVIRARLRGRATPPAFRYRHVGNLATIGRGGAVADFGFVQLSGRLAWWLWGSVHIFFLIGFRNRVAVALDWLWSYLTFQRGARLITGDPEG